MRGNRQSGGVVGSGATVVPMSDRARRLMAAIALSLDAEGTVQATLPALAAMSSQSLATAERAMVELVAAGLVRTVGSTRAAARFVDRRLLEVLHGSAPAPTPPPMPAPAPPPDAEQPTPTDRTTRARLGGLQRALASAQAQRDEAQRKLRSKEATGGAVTALLIADLRHAFGCRAPACVRCAGIRQRLSERHPSYVGEVAAHDVADAIERGALAARAGATLSKALEHRGVGAHARVATARRALAMAVEGDVHAADQLLRTLEG